MDNIGSRILSIRESRELNQAEFAEVFQVSRQTVSNWETNRKPPDIDKIIKISEFGNVSLDWLITGVDKTLEYKKEIDEKDLVIKELLTKYSELSHSVGKDILNHGSKRMDKSLG